MKPALSARAPSATTLTRGALLGGLTAGSLVALAGLPRRAFAMPIERRGQRTALDIKLGQRPVLRPVQHRDER